MQEVSLGMVNVRWVQRRTSRRISRMSALPPKADINGRIFDVRFVPKADVCRPALLERCRRRKSQALAVTKNADGQRRNDKHDQKAAEYQSHPKTW